MKFLKRQTMISYLGGSPKCPRLIIYDLILLAVVLLFCFPAYSNTRVIQSQLPDCEGTDIAAYSMCFGMFENDTFKYEGEWKNGLRDGIGLFAYSDGKSSYKGQWLAGNAAGYGVFTYADGSIYVGGWKQNKRHGKGRLTLANGNERSGAWMLGKLLPQEFLAWAYSVMSRSINIDFSNITEGTMDLPGPPISKTCPPDVALRIQIVTEEEARRVIDIELESYLYVLVVRLAELIGIDSMIEVVDALNAMPNFTPEERAELQQSNLGKNIQATVLPEVQRSISILSQSLMKSMPKIFSLVEKRLALEGINKVSEHNWCLKRNAQ